MEHPSQTNLASSVNRILARLVDGLLVWLITAGLMFGVGLVLGIVTVPIGMVMGQLALAAPFALVAAGVGKLLGLVTTLLPFAYYVVLESSPWQATLGKRWLGCQIGFVNPALGHAPTQMTLLQAVIRNAVLIVSSLLIIPLLVSAVMLFVHPQRQTLHDLVAKTLVLNK